MLLKDVFVNGEEVKGDDHHAKDIGSNLLDRSSE